MTATIFAPPDKMIRLSGISWKTSKTLLEESLYPYLSLKRKITKFSTNVAVFAMIIGVLSTNKP